MPKLTAKQKKFFVEYEAATTFEAMHVDEVIEGAITFEAAAKANCDWFENWMRDAHNAATRAMYNALLNE